VDCDADESEFDRVRTSGESVTTVPGIAVVAVKSSSDCVDVEEVEDVRLTLLRVGLGDAVIEVSTPSTGIACTKPLEVTINTAMTAHNPNSLHPLPFRRHPRILTVLVRSISSIIPRTFISRRKGKGWRDIGLWAVMAVLMVTSTGFVQAVPVEGVETSITASPSLTLSGVSRTSSTSSTSTQSGDDSTTTTAVPGTVVTDSPLVRTRSNSDSSASQSTVSGESLSGNQSFTASVTESITRSTASSTTNSQTILPSPTTDNDGNNNGSGSSNPQESTYNSLLNFYFLILAGVIGFAVLGWWMWRRRRRGKTNRDQRRGLEALRQDLELGRLRRGFLGVVGRGGNNTTTPTTPPSEELPAYQPVRPPPAAVIRPPGYDVPLVPRPRTASGGPLGTIEEEQSISSRAVTPEIPPHPDDERHGADGDELHE